MDDLATAELEKPSKAVAVALLDVIDKLDLSPVVPDFIVNTLLTVSYSTFMPYRCSTAARSKAPFGTAFCPVKPASVNVVRATGNPST
jgi:hypothetical protein